MSGDIHYDTWIIAGEMYVKSADVTALRAYYVDTINSWNKALETEKAAHKKKIDDIEILRANEKIWAGRVEEEKSNKAKNLKLYLEKMTELNDEVKKWKDYWKELNGKYNALKAKYDDPTSEDESEDESDDEESVEVTLLSKTD